MRRATITIPDDLETDLEAFLKTQEAPPSLTVLMQTALRRFLAEMRLEQRGYRPPSQPLHVTPASSGSGRSDVSIRHDRELAEA